VPLSEDLPPYLDESEIKLKTPDEIARRVISSLITIQVACDMQNGFETAEESRGFFYEEIQRFGLEDDLTEAEKRVFFEKPTEQELTDIAWKYESCWVLLWSLGLIEKLDYPKKLCDAETAIDIIFQSLSLEEFLQDAKMRSASEILDEADLAMRYDHVCNTAKQKGKVPPCKLNGGVISERHHALKWLTGDESAKNWDNITANA